MRLRRLLLISVVAVVAIAGVPGQASAQTPQPEHLASLVRSLLLSENQSLVDTVPSASVAPLSGAAVAKVAARAAIMRDRAFAKDLAGTRFTSVDTEVVVTSVDTSGESLVAEALERTVYSIEGVQATYGYTARYSVTFAQVGLPWTIADIDALDSAADFTARRIAYVQSVDEKTRRSDIAARVSALRAGVEGNADILAAGDAAKMSGQQVGAPADALQETTAVGVARAGDVGRPADRPLTTSGGGATGPAGTPGSGPPYNYQAMVDWVLKYAKDEPVPYTRDTNDCTTFISWGLYQGGWAEVGSEAFLSTLLNRDDDDVWYWRCNDCDPRHSHTWGGALNWHRFAINEGKRVKPMPYLTDLLVSDVMQMDFDGYGSPDNIPDHTMMVTGRDASGNALLSYHTADTRNKLIWDVISGQDGPYWALRT